MHTSVDRREVAKKAGVSAPTVSRALSGSPLVNEKTREHIKAVARRLGYTPNRQASLLARKKTFRIGFVIPYYKNIPPFSRAYFPVLLDGIIVTAEEQGYAVTIILDKRGEEYKDLAQLVKGKEVDGLLLTIIKINDPRLADLQKEKVPLVLINSRQPGLCSVDNNPRPGLELAFEHIRKLGHKRLGFITGDREYHNSQDRLEAFNELARQAGMETVVAEGNFSRTSGYYSAGKLLQANPRPTAILASSDREALGVLEYCRDHSIRVPEDLSVIGYDNFDPAISSQPPLTTIDNPARQTGAEASKLLIEMIEGRVKKAKEIQLDTGFVERKSTGLSLSPALSR
jgi:LacI family transcriptional regulator